MIIQDPSFQLQSLPYPFQLTISITSDINKFLWMVRIGGSTEKGDHIKEQQYYTPSGEFRVDAEGSPTLLNCLMYKLCYYRFGQVYTEGGEKNGFVAFQDLTLKSRLFPMITHSLTLLNFYKYLELVWMPCRKIRETKHHLSRARSGHLITCCSVSLAFPMGHPV